MKTILIFCIFLITCFFAYAYKVLWVKSSNKNKVPTGFGIIFIYMIALFSYVIMEDKNFTLIFIIIALFSSIYWIDDVYYLSSIFRFILQFFTGSIVALITLYLSDVNLGNYTLLFILFFGISNIFFSNVINFYDGLDLNIATLILIFCFVMILFMNLKSGYSEIGLIISSFIIGFSIFNIKPNNIFFGDSGCFAFASFINLTLIQSFLNFDIQSMIFIFIPLALPIVDVAYVIFLRMRLKESLLSRNYHHLYHKIESRYQNKAYLAPQLINVVGLLTISILIPFYTVNYIIIFILLSIMFTFFNYFIIRSYIELGKIKKNE